MRLLLTVLVLLWAQLFWTLVPSWRFGEYYTFGWFVPVLAAGLTWRRWQMIAPILPAAPLRPKGWVVAVGTAAVLAIAPLRLIAETDPSWRPPLLAHALLVFGLTHFLLWKLLGRRVSLGMLPATLFALIAVPYPWQFEQQLIRQLTETVVGLTREVFLLGGQPVELQGDRLAMGSQVVEVTDGCSGIRSFQSLVMVALFFGELLFLSLPKRLTLILVAGACAIGVNTLRAFWLAEIHFSRGREAAAGAHDGIGHIAFLASAAILYLSALGMLRATPTGQLVVRRSHAAPL